MGIFLLKAIFLSHLQRRLQKPVKHRLKIEDRTFCENSKWLLALYSFLTSVTLTVSNIWFGCFLVTIFK